MISYCRTIEPPDVDLAQLIGHVAVNAGATVSPLTLKVQSVHDEHTRRRGAIFYHGKSGRSIPIVDDNDVERSGKEVVYDGF